MIECKAAGNEDHSKYVLKASGTTAERTAAPGLGQPYFDTDLGYMIWYDGANWVNATGATV